MFYAVAGRSVLSGPSTKWLADGLTPALPKPPAYGSLVGTLGGRERHQRARDVQDLLGTTTPLEDRALLCLQLVNTGGDVDHHLAGRRRDQSLGDANEVV
jgi:hypothetical protein